LGYQEETAGLLVPIDRAAIGNGPNPVPPIGPGPGPGLRY